MEKRDQEREQNVGVKDGQTITWGISWKTTEERKD